MIAQVSGSTIIGICNAPPSKSVMQRICALALLNKGTVQIIQPGTSDDDLTALRIITQLGADVSPVDSGWQIKGQGWPKPNSDLTCGESGLSFRMFAAIAALYSGKITLDARGSLLKRPQQFIEKVFPQLGVNVHSQHGFPPITVEGPMKARSISFDASNSSQYLTGLLFALARIADKRITLTVDNLQSKPYIDLSLYWLHQFGYQVSHEDYHLFHIDRAQFSELNESFVVEGDWSGASFLLVAAALTGKATVKGLVANSLQADAAILPILQQAGALLFQTEDTVTVSASSLKSFEADARNCPDLFPPLVALASGCEGVSRIRGISRLLNKESNRAETLQLVFNQMGVPVKLNGDYLEITGPVSVSAATVDSFGDHRIAMAVAVAALNGKGTVTINGAAAVNKSFPDFFNTLKTMGANLSITDIENNH